MEKEWLNCEMHCHTYNSRCSSLKYETIIKHCKIKKIDVIAITDHNNVNPSLEFAKIAPDWLKVITGQEIKTASGEIIGLFTTENIAKEQDLRKTMLAVKEQGGLVCIPHPFDSIRSATIKISDLEKNLDLVDMVEVYNSRVLKKTYNTKALKFAGKHSLSVVCGSDAHFSIEIGKSILKIPHFNNAEEFKNQLDNAIISGRRSPAIVNLFSKISKFIKK